MSRLIDADELKNALAEMWYENNIRITGLSVAELIDHAPTIEPRIKFDFSKLSSSQQFELKRHISAVRPKGEWKTNQTYKTLVYCSECGMAFKDSLLPRNYCPCCGAEMK